MQKKQDSGALVSLQKMARDLGVPVRWLRDQAEAGNVPGLRAGNRWLFVPDIATAAVRSMAGDALSGLLIDQSLKTFNSAVQSGESEVIKAARKKLQNDAGDELALVDPVDLENATPPVKSKGGEK